MQDVTKQMQLAPEVNAKQIADSERDRDAMVTNRHDRRASAAIARCNAELKAELAKAR